VYEVMGPVFAKVAIEKAGEIDGLSKSQAPQMSQEVLG
jgi:hypothetical protein